MQTLLTTQALREASVHLPSSVKLIDTLYRALQQPDVDAEKVIGLMSMDIGIATRLLRMANTASLSRGETVTSIEQALSWLGMAQAYRVTCATLSAKLCEQSLPLYRISGEKLLANSIAMAVGMEVITKKTDLDPKTAYTIGLMHNLGRIVLQRVAAHQDIPVGSADLSDHAAVMEWERTHLGCTHPEAGAAVLKLWGLNGLFCDVITHQYEPDYAQNEQVRRWSALIHITASAVATTDFGLGVTGDAWPLNETMFATAGLANVDILELGEEITVATTRFCEQSGLHLQAGSKPVSRH